MCVEFEIEDLFAVFMRMNPTIVLGVFWSAVHILIGLGLGYFARIFMLWHLDDGYAFTLTQWGWIRTAALRAWPWQIVGLLLAWVFLASYWSCMC